MALRRLCKSGDSHVDGECPAVYVDDDPAMMIGQGTVLDPTRTAELRDVAADEAGVVIPTETVLRAAALFLAERGRPAMLQEVESYLSGTGT